MLVGQFQKRSWGGRQGVSGREDRWGGSPAVGRRRHNCRRPKGYRLLEPRLASPGLPEFGAGAPSGLTRGVADKHRCPDDDAKLLYCTVVGEPWLKLVAGLMVPLGGVPVLLLLAPARRPPHEVGPALASSSPAPRLAPARSDRTGNRRPRIRASSLGVTRSPSAAAACPIDPPEGRLVEARAPRSRGSGRRG